MNTIKSYQGILGFLPLFLLLSVLAISCNQDVTSSADEAVLSAQLTTMANLEDTTCQPGFFSVDGLSPCTPCPVGTYQDEEGQTSCKLAEPGSFVDTEGAAASTLCPIGTFSDVYGAAECTACAIGETTDGPGATECIPNDPVTKTDCMEDGWEAFDFKNQGECIRFVETGKDSR
jgi:hypothetical protein